MIRIPSVLASLPAALLLLGWTACDGSGPSAADLPPTAEEPPTPDFTERPRGVKTLAAADLTVFVDVVRARCHDGEATVLLDAVGEATHAEVDLIDPDERSVQAISMTQAPFVDGNLWRRFDGAGDCGSSQPTVIARTWKGSGTEDCVVHGPAARSVLAGRFDATLAEAGRPSVEGCRAVHESPRR